MKIYECRECGEEFEHVAPGRPPLSCADCRERQATATPTEEPRIRGKELVDRVEFNLKARGLHISQWRDKYE